MTGLVYVYAILEARAPAVQALMHEDVRGIEGARVGAVRSGDLAAAVSTVPEAEFESAPLNQLVATLDWLAPRAAEHQRVAAWLFSRADAVLPLAFGAVYRGTTGVERLLETEGSSLLTSLDGVRHCAEWVLSLRRDAVEAIRAVEATSPALTTNRKNIAAATPGRAYLLSRQREALTQRELLAQDARALGALDGLVRLARRSHPEPLAPDRESGLLARTSLLLERHSEPDLLATLEAMQRNWRPLGYDLTATGPWPAYSFSRLDREPLGSRG